MLSIDLKNFFNENASFELFYSYGIPIYQKYARVNWLHVSNILPFMKDKFPLTLQEKLKIEILKNTFNSTLKNPDIISAESHASLDQINSKNLFLSENGSDEEIYFFKNRQTATFRRKNTAIIVGTYKYKALNDAYKIFQKLQLENSNLKLIIIGNKSPIPKALTNDSSVILAGLLSRDEVAEHLISSKFYLSATLVENSYNAASEGVFLSQTSIISDILPHRELLKYCNVKEYILPESKRVFLKVQNTDLKISNIKSWDQVISELVSKLQEVLRLN